MKAFDYHPPIHPNEEVSQSTNYYSARESRVPVWMKWAPSMAAVAEKAQHDPHYPWSLTGLTAPLVIQSTESVMFEESR